MCCMHEQNDIENWFANNFCIIIASLYVGIRLYSFYFIMFSITKKTVESIQHNIDNNISGSLEYICQANLYIFEYAWQAECCLFIHNGNKKSWLF